MKNANYDSETSIHSEVQRIRAAIPLVGYKEFHNLGHFRGSDLGKNEFPELLEEIV